MRTRRFWLDLLRRALRQRSVAWISGVRRVGKTVLCQSLPNTEYFDCELPRIRRLWDDPETFLKDLRGRTIVLDEIHRLDDPSQVLKIAADHFPDTPVVATGSSTLSASTKFRDTLAGRKVELWLTPLMSKDLDDFGRPALPHRLARGGLPPFFLADEPPDRDFQEWMDAYWAKDIQELFRLERRSSFQKFTELLFAQSGGLFEATKFARPCEVSRPTISNYLAVLEATFVAHVLRPFNTHRRSEITSAPKVYGFDTGFVSYYRGWSEPRREDFGALWEHFVLNEMHAHLQSRAVRYWRDKRGHEVDFVWVRPGRSPVAIEAKWSASDFDPSNVKAFRRLYPRGETFLVAQDVTRGHPRRYGDLEVRVVTLTDLVDALM